MIPTSLCIAGDKEGINGKTIITQRGDELTLSIIPERAIHIENTDKTITAPVGRAKPVLLNGKEIYYYKDHPDNEQPEKTESYKHAQADYMKFKNMIDKAIAIEKEKLPDGTYIFVMKNMVVDENGYIAYYETDGIKRILPGSGIYTPQTAEVDKTTAHMLNGIIMRVANKMQYTPFVLTDSPAPYLSQYKYFLNKGEPVYKERRLKK